MNQMTQTHTVLTADELVANAEALVPLLRAEAAEAERLGKLTDKTIDAFRDAGFFHAMRPASTGGSAIGFGTFIDIVRILSRGDASAGWVGAFMISHDWLLTRLNADAQAEIFEGGRPGLAAAMAAPPGTAEPVEGGWKVNGRWRFGSSIMHANWAIVSAGAPDGPPLTVVARVDEGEIIDTWQVPGMKATGSNDFALVDAFIPAHRVVDLMTYASRHNDGAALYPDYEILQYPMYRVLSLIHGAVAVGTAEAALELFPESVAKRQRPGSGPIIEEAETHAAYGEAMQTALVARLMLDDAVARTERLFAKGAPDPSPADLTLLNLSNVGSGTEALKAVDTLVQAAGASVMRNGTPLEMICRNAAVMRNHVALDWRHNQRLAGRIGLGLDLGLPFDPAYGEATP